jgi:hypothetical protein
MKIIGIITVVILAIVLIFCVGPLCLAYDINHLSLALAPEKKIHVEWTQLPIFIVGIFLSEIAVPVALVLWVLVTIGIMA